MSLNELVSKRRIIKETGWSRDRNPILNETYDCSQYVHPELQLERKI